MTRDLKRAMIRFAVLLLTVPCLAGSQPAGERKTPSMDAYVLNFDTPTDPALQRELEASACGSL
jgi:hypothetical protein